MEQILLVEDDPIIANGLEFALGQEGYFVIHCNSASKAINVLQNEHIDLAILDIQLPDGTGFDVRAKITKIDTAIIFLTVVDDEGNIVKAFEGGADDYITKPFRLGEFLARVKRTLRIRGKAHNNSLLSIGDIQIDTKAVKVWSREKVIDLTAIEYRLLLTFASSKGQLITRAQILENIWDHSGNYVEDNTLTVYIKRLRNKLGDSINIETVRGLGYRAN